MAATSTGSDPGSGINANLFNCAPISTAARTPNRGSPMTATCPPALVTAATTPSNNEPAPDTETTVPRTNPPCGSTPAMTSGTGRTERVRPAAFGDEAVDRSSTGCVS